MTSENQGILSDAQIQEIRKRHPENKVIEPSLTKAELLELIAIRLRDPKTDIRVFTQLSSQFIQLTKTVLIKVGKPGAGGKRRGRPPGSKNKYVPPPTVMDLVKKMEASGKQPEPEISQA